MMATGARNGNKVTNDIREYVLWGIGGQAAYAGFTLGASYVDAGNMGTQVGEDKDQDVFSVGLKYEFDKVAMAVNYMNGEGYLFTGGAATDYVDRYSALGFGTTYTWFPGLTTALDAVFFDQSRDAQTYDNEGHVLMLSQKMTF
jgi:predicted porin